MSFPSVRQSFRRRNQCDYNAKRVKKPRGMSLVFQTMNPKTSRQNLLNKQPLKVALIKVNCSYVLRQLDQNWRLRPTFPPITSRLILNSLKLCGKGASNFWCLRIPCPNRDTQFEHPTSKDRRQKIQDKLCQMLRPFVLGWHQ